MYGTSNNKKKCMHDLNKVDNKITKTINFIVVEIFILYY